MMRYAAPFMLMLATACTGPAPIAPQQGTPRPTMPSPAEDTCNAARYAGLIGQDATALERVLILSQVRVIRPGQAVTMDYRAERINFNVDEGNRITSIICT